MGKAKNNRENLGFLDQEFEKKLVKILIEDYKFFGNIESILDQNCFTLPELREIVKTMKELYHDVERAPLNYDALLTRLKFSISDMVRLNKIVDTIKEIRDNTDKSFYTQCKEDAERYFKQQKLLKAVKEAEKILERGDYRNYPKIGVMIQECLDVNCFKNEDFKLFDEDWEDALNGKARITVPTGSDHIDDMLHGGIGIGELGVIIAPSGVGKTSATCGFVANAALKGFNVLHIFFEDMVDGIKRKYYGYLLEDIEAGELLKPSVASIAKARLRGMENERKMLNEHVRCCRGLNGQMTAHDVESKIKHHIARGFIPNLVVVDYFECLSMEFVNPGESEFTREGFTMRILERICQEYNVAMWVPVQGTKNSFNAEVLGMEHAGGSIKKVQIGHIVMSFSKIDDGERERGVRRMNIGLSKLRAGAIKNGGQIRGIAFNNGTCRFGNVLDEGPEQSFVQTERDSIAISAKRATHDKTSYNKNF